MDRDIRAQLVTKYAERLAFYRSQHRTFGCKVTHMVGIPLIALSLPTLVVSPKSAAKMQIGGWILQFIGHFVFEHNKPVLLETKDPLVVVAALQFCGELWYRVWRGQHIAMDEHERVKISS
jgi:uncharacterized membrane protein YGL010W